MMKLWLLQSDPDSKLVKKWNRAAGGKSGKNGLSLPPNSSIDKKEKPEHIIPVIKDKQKVHPQALQTEQALPMQIETEQPEP